MEFFRSRRTVRVFADQEVEEEKVRTVLEAACWAPSWANSQPWRFLVVKDPVLREKLARLDKSRRKPLEGAPCIIAACGLREKSGYIKGEKVTSRGDLWYLFDLGLAAENLSLAAHTLGLGTVTVGWYDEVEAGQALGLPAGWDPVVLIGIGYPLEAPKAPGRQPMEEVVFWEKVPPEMGRREMTPGKVIITVLGVDKVGIIAGVAGVLASLRANIVDIRETTMGEYLTMIMIADLQTCSVTFDELLNQLEAKGREIGVQVNMQHEDAFRFMHRV